MTNDEGVLINDEARMTNDEGMTKSEAQKPCSVDDFLRMVARVVPALKLQARELWMEARELHFDLLKNLERPEE